MGVYIYSPSPLLVFVLALSLSLSLSCEEVDTLSLGELLLQNTQSC